MKKTTKKITKRNFRKASLATQLEHEQIRSTRARMMYCDAQAKLFLAQARIKELEYQGKFPGIHTARLVTEEIEGLLTEAENFACDAEYNRNELSRLRAK